MSKVLTIAIAEDEDTLREIYKIRFQNAGFQVFDFKDGLTLLTWLSEHTPSAILLDILMPEMNGYEVLSAIHKNFSDKNIEHVPVVVCSNLTDEAEVKKALSAGAKFFFKKIDADPDSIVAKVISLTV